MGNGWGHPLTLHEGYSSCLEALFQGRRVEEEQRAYELQCPP